MLTRHLLAIAVVLAPATALADIQSNGVQLNGVQLNGVQLNGVQLNGVQLNGVQLNGTQLSGITLNGSALNIQMVAPTNGLPHHEQATGVRLVDGSSACVTEVCSRDSFCCTTSWDSYCVREANTYCTRANYSGGAIVGGTVGATLSQPLSNGATTVALKIDGVSSMAAPYYRFVNGRLMNVAVYHQISYQSFCAHSPTVTGGALAADCSSCAAQVIARDPYCGRTSWDGLCVSEANAWCGSTANATWSPICGYNSDSSGVPNGSPTNAVLVAGAWDYREGVEGGGAKISSSNTDITLACQAKGAVAKCVDMGYQWWRNADYDNRHQACIRMVRADYCGDGRTWTTNGTPINVWDDAGIQSDTAAWTFEATWTPAGATCVDEARQETTTSGTTQTLHLYGKNLPYGCSVGGWVGAPDGDPYELCIANGATANVVSEKN